MKKILLLILFLSSITLSALSYNPKWISIRTVEEVVIDGKATYPDKFNVCRSTNETVRLEFKFQQDPGPVDEIFWRIHGLAGLVDVSLVGSPAYTGEINVSGLPAGDYYAEADFGDTTIKVHGYTNRFSVIEVEITPVDFVQMDIHRSFEYTITPFHPNASTIKFDISRFTFGGIAGEAKFKNGTTTKTVNIVDTQLLNYLFIKGTEASIPANPQDPQNMKLIATIDGNTALCGIEFFEVKDCSAAFAGVTFTVTNLEVTASEDAFIFHDPLKSFLTLQSQNSVKWQPYVRIFAPSVARASEFEVGFVQIVEDFSTSIDKYDNNREYYITTPNPIRDSIGNAATIADELYYNVLESHLFGKFTHNNGIGDTVLLEWEDSPKWVSFLNYWDIPNVEPNLQMGRLLNSRSNIQFKLWIVIRHTDPITGVKCLLVKDWIKWETDFEVGYIWNPDGTLQSKTWLNGRNKYKPIPGETGVGGDGFIHTPIVGNSIIARKTRLTQ